MPDIDLAFLARQLERVLTELRSNRTELHLLREEIRLLRSDIGRIDDAVTYDVLERIRQLEQQSHSH